jgi:hypothetical protein
MLVTPLTHVEANSQTRLEEIQEKLEDKITNTEQLEAIIRGLQEKIKEKQ